jgi:hypothetical protein
MLYFLFRLPRPTKYEAKQNPPSAGFVASGLPDAAEDRCGVHVRFSNFSAIHLSGFLPKTQITIFQDCLASGMGCAPRVVIMKAHDRLRSVISILKDLR